MREINSNVLLEFSKKNLVYSSILFQIFGAKMRARCAHQPAFSLLQVVLPERTLPGEDHFAFRATVPSKANVPRRVIPAP